MRKALIVVVVVLHTHTQTPNSITIIIFLPPLSISVWANLQADGRIDGRTDTHIYSVHASVWINVCAYIYMCLCIYVCLFECMSYA